MANFCSQCGAPLPEGAKFCGKCGKKVEEVQVKNITQPPADNVKKNAEQAVSNNADNTAVVQENITANVEKINDSTAKTFSEKTVTIQQNSQEGRKVDNQAVGDDKAASKSTDERFRRTSISNGLSKASILPNIDNGQFAFSANDKLDPANDVTIKEKYFNYKGRLNRKRYFFRTLILSFIFGFAGTILGSILPILVYPVWIVWIVSVAMLAIRRLHDLNKSGWFYLLTLIPVVNFLVGIYLTFAKGTIGPNQYGPDPLANEHLR